MATPTLVQMVSSSTNLNGIQGQAGSNFKFTLPNACQSGNCLVLALSYQSGTTVGVSDNLGNTWSGTPDKSVDSGTMVASIFVLPNTGAGRGTFHVTCSPASIPFQYVMSEWCNVATSSPVNGTSGTASVAGRNIAAGSFTPTTNNDANGGNLIYAYFAVDVGISAAGTTNGWAAGGSFSILNADNWQGNAGMLEASEFWVQAAQAAVNPGMTAPTTDSFNSISIALKAASAGSPKPAVGSGTMWIDHLYHFSNISAPSSWTFQSPTTGNLWVAAWPDGAGITSVSDSSSGSWNSRSGSPDGITCVIKDSVNRTPSASLTVTFAMGSDAGNNRSMRFFDISNADSSPFDTHTFANSITGNVTVRNDFPDYTPNVLGLVIANGACGLGPCTGFNTGTPANAIFDMCTYPEETDGSAMENADILGHYFNPNLSTITWNWTVASTNAGAAAMAAGYKAAAAGSNYQPWCEWGGYSPGLASIIARRSVGWTPIMDHPRRRIRRLPRRRVLLLPSREADIVKAVRKRYG